MNEIISLLTNKDYALGDKEKRKPFIFVDRQDPAFGPDPIQTFINMSPPRQLKTHLPGYLVRHWFDCEDVKFVLILRNPKDALVAMYHFYRGLPGEIAITICFRFGII